MFKLVILKVRISHFCFVIAKHLIQAPLLSIVGGYNSTLPALSKIDIVSG